MSDIYTYFGLRDQPFGAAADPRFVYSAGTYQSAWTGLVQAVESNLGISVVAGEPGMGKTTLLFRLIERFRPTATVAFIFETQCSATGLLRHVAREFGLPSTATDTADPATLYEALFECIIAAARAGKRVLLVIDEAQNLQLPALETIRLLSNIETSRGKLLHIVLAGHVSFLTRLSTEELEQLQQRIWTTRMLSPLDAGETAEYVTHRLSVAGYEGIRLFDDDALMLLASESRGIPRLINRLCFHALTEAFVRGKRTIDRTLLQSCVSGFCNSAPADKTRKMVVTTRR